MKNDFETAQSDVFFPDFPEKKGENAPLQQKFLPSQRRWQACNKIFWPPSAAGGFAKKFYDLPAALASLQKNFTAFLTYRFLHSCEIGRTAKDPSRSPRGRDLPSAGVASRHVAGYA